VGVHTFALAGQVRFIAVRFLKGSAKVLSLATALVFYHGGRRECGGGERDYHENAKNKGM
jgi:hypothetical protein